MGGAAPIKEKRERTNLDHSAMYKWQRDLCRAIADANFCFYWTLDTFEKTPRVSHGRSYHHKVKQHCLLGKESNVLAVQFMYGWLVDAIESLSPYKGAQRNSRSGISWKEGCASRLIERVNEKAYRMQQDETKIEGQTSTTGMMLVSIHKTEYELNFDALCGEGAYARSQQKAAEEKLMRAERVAEEKTPEQIEKERKASERWWKKYRNEQERAASRKDHQAFNQGRLAGNDISLDDKLTTSKGA